MRSQITPRLTKLHARFIWRVEPERYSTRMHCSLPAFATLVLLAGNAAVAADYPLLAVNAPPSPADNEAAARHAKLTACLKEAKEKKLVGPQKAAFIKECVAAR